MLMNLKAARVNAGLTQEQVAEALKLSRTTIQKYEAYAYTPTVITALELVKLYGLNINDVKWDL